ncbi:MAG: helix-turn-helix domain-containing protein [Micavibrio sp.]|nr:helix-turn-helix domain-containing protein [Micavibrio sp.]
MKNHSVTEALQIMGIGKTRLYEEIKLGKIKAVKCGRRTLISDVAIEEWAKALPDAQHSAS